MLVVQRKVRFKAVRWLTSAPEGNLKHYFPKRPHFGKISYIYVLFALARF